MYGFWDTCLGLKVSGHRLAAYGHGGVLQIDALVTKCVLMYGPLAQVVSSKITFASCVLDSIGIQHGSGAWWIRLGS